MPVFDNIHLALWLPINLFLGKCGGFLMTSICLIQKGNAYQLCKWGYISMKI